MKTRQLLQELALCGLAFGAGFFACFLVDLLIVRGALTWDWIWEHVLRGRNGLDLALVIAVLGVVYWLWSHIDDTGGGEPDSSDPKKRGEQDE